MTIQQLQKLSYSKDPDVIELVEEYKTIMDSNNLDAYLSMRDQLNDWDKQLKIKQGGNSTIDLFSDKDAKEFDRATKYYDKILIYRKTLSDLKASLTEVETVTLMENESIKKSKEKNKMLSI